MTDVGSPPSNFAAVRFVCGDGEARGASAPGQLLSYLSIFMQFLAFLAVIANCRAHSHFVVPERDTPVFTSIVNESINMEISVNTDWRHIK